MLKNKPLHDFFKINAYQYKHIEHLSMTQEVPWTQMKMQFCYFKTMHRKDQQPFPAILSRVKVFTTVVESPNLFNHFFFSHRQEWAELHERHLGIRRATECIRFEGTPLLVGFLLSNSYFLSFAALNLNTHVFRLRPHFKHPNVQYYYDLISNVTMISGSHISITNRSKHFISK